MSRTPNFDHLAGIYRWLEFASFGGALGRCRCHFLSELNQCRRAVVLGDGDGRFTAQLLKTNRDIQVDAVDASAAMLRALLHRAGGDRGRVRTYCSDVRDWEPEALGYDLVVSHFFLDCLTTREVGALASRVRTRVLPNAKWLISEFAVSEDGFGKAVARPVVSGLYAAFGLLTGLQTRRLPDYRQELEKESFICDARQELLHGLLVSELWSKGAPELSHSC